MVSQEEQLKIKMAEWREWMSGQDPHSIHTQIAVMMRDDAVYRVIDRCRRLAPQAQQGGVQLNVMVHHLIDRCFFQAQVLAIRRLIDRRSDVISLGRLIDDMEKHAHFLRRGNLFEAQDLCYDYEPVRHEYYQQQLKLSNGGPRSTCKELTVDDWVGAERLHQHVDRLSRTEPTERTRVDLIDKRIFAGLRRKLSPCRTLKKAVDKLVAHAADAADRRALCEELGQVSLGQLWDCHEVICEVASFVGVVLLGGSQAPGLPIPQYKRFVYLDRPWIHRSGVRELRDMWREHEREVAQWCSLKWPDGWDED